MVMVRVTGRTENGYPVWAVDSTHDGAHQLFRSLGGYIVDRVEDVDTSAGEAHLTRPVEPPPIFTHWRGWVTFLVVTSISTWFVVTSGLGESGWRFLVYIAAAITSVEVSRAWWRWSR